jgi:hypothetical protein
VFATVTVTGEDVATLALRSVVEAVRVWLPSEPSAVFQETLYGEEVTAEPNGLPSRENWTEAMPAVEVAVAATVTVEKTVAPSAGEVIEVETPVSLTVSVTGIVCGELEAWGSAIVAVAW